jgi:hypothetical protein
MLFEKAEEKGFVVGHDPAAADQSMDLYGVILRSDQHEAFVKAARDGGKATLIGRLDKGALTAYIEGRMRHRAAFIEAVGGRLAVVGERLVEPLASASNTNMRDPSTSNTSASNTSASNTNMRDPSTSNASTSNTSASTVDQPVVIVGPRTGDGGPNFYLYQLPVASNS